MDNYDLVVLKTVAICEYGVSTRTQIRGFSSVHYVYGSEKKLIILLAIFKVTKVAAKYVMKCDDDTFVRVETVLKEANKVADHGSLYVGNINYNHKPLRSGKWAVTYEVLGNTTITHNPQLYFQLIYIYIYDSFFLTGKLFRSGQKKIIRPMPMAPATLFHRTLQVS